MKDGCFFCAVGADQHDDFDDMPEALAARSMFLAQCVARALRLICCVEHVALLAAGTGLAHAHLHLVPMHEKTDVTSARYMAEPAVFADPDPEPRAALDPVAARIAKLLEAQE